MRERRPSLHRRTEIHRTGDAPPSLDDVGAVFFWLGDPLKELYPECYRDAATIAHEASRRGARLINPPDALSNAIKSRQSAIWSQNGVPCAKAWPAPSRHALNALASAIPYPAILRFDEGHAQHSMVVCRMPEDVEAAADHLRYPAVALEFIDARATWRARAPTSIYAKFFHKKRAMVFGDAVINNHVLFSKNPLVSGRSATLARDKLPHNKLLRRIGLRRWRYQEALREDRTFAFSPPQHADVLRRAVRSLGLDIAAIDYASCADGSIVVWEANPYFYLRHWSEISLGDGRALDKRNPRFYDAALDVLSEAVAQPAALGRRERSYDLAEAGGHG